MKAKIVEGEFLVRHTVRPDVGREFLTWSIAGWDEVKKVCKKIVSYDGRKFQFSGWNSDRDEIFFFRPLNGEVLTARFDK